MKIDRWPPRHWAVYDDDDELVCVTVCKKGAREVVRRITHLTQIHLNSNSRRTLPMIDTSMCFADLSGGDEFESNQYSCAASKRYLKLSVLFREGIGNYANAVEIHTGDPALFQPEDRVTLVCSASELADSDSKPERSLRAETRC
jgi:hypothetical protein